MAKLSNKNRSISKSASEKSSSVVKKKSVLVTAETSKKGEKQKNASTLKSLAPQTFKVSSLTSPKKKKNIAQQLSDLNLILEDLKRENTIKTEQLLQKVSFLNIQSENMNAPSHISDEIRKIKMDITDMNNNIFHIHKIVKNTSDITQKRINHLFIKTAFLILSAALAIILVTIWISTNPS